MAAEPSLCFQNISILYAFSESSSQSLWNARSFNSLIAKRRPSALHSSATSNANFSNSWSKGMPALTAISNRMIYLRFNISLYSLLMFSLRSKYFFLKALSKNCDIGNSLFIRSQLRSQSFFSSRFMDSWSGTRHDYPGGVLRYISDGDVRSPFLGLKFAI